MSHSVSITDYFKLLGAPLANQRWSWGAVRESDKAVFLRVWQDQVRKIDGTMFALVADHAWHANNPSHPGYRERLAHIAAIRGGAKGYLIMCAVKDKTAEPRDIQSFDRESLFVAGRLRGDEIEERLELSSKVTSRSARPNASLERTRGE